MRSILCVALWLASATYASASGGLDCSAADPSVEFELMAGVTRGLGGPTFNFRGELEILDASIAADLRKTTFEDSNLAQYWLDGKELRLLVYRERRTDRLFGELELEVRTQAGDEEGLFGGRYKLTVSDNGVGGAEGKTATIEGTVDCWVE